MSKPKSGDVFVVPTGDGRAGIGRVVAAYGTDAYFFAIFDLVLPVNEARERVSEAPFCTGAISRTLVGRQASRGRLGGRDSGSRRPGDPVAGLQGGSRLFGPGRGGRLLGAAQAACDFLRGCRLAEQEGRCSSASRTRVRATLGLEPWLEQFDELRVENVTPTASLFPG